MAVVVVDYKAGNLTSVRLAIEALGVACEVTSDPQTVRAADRVIFPGVGAAGAAMRDLSGLQLDGAIRQVISDGVPFLGICLGTQIIFSRSEEDGGTACLGIIPGTVTRFQPTDHFDKIPHMGWNAVQAQRPHPVLSGIEDGSEFYFVHSYYPQPDESSYVIGETTYADACFASVVGRGNLIATQFHPERSGRIGMRLLENFMHWDGQC